MKKITLLLFALLLTFNLTQAQSTLIETFNHVSDDIGPITGWRDDPATLFTGSTGYEFTIPDGNIGPSLYCAVIVKRVDERTRSKTSINDLLRD